MDSYLYNTSLTLPAVRFLFYRVRADLDCHCSYYKNTIKQQALTVHTVLVDVSDNKEHNGLAEACFKFRRTLQLTVYSSSTGKQLVLHVTK